jgi:hypothetical protein
MMFVENDKAVTESMGTILLVAITVMIAAIIAAYVMGVVGKVDSEKTVAVTAERQSENIIKLTYHGGQDSDKLNYLIIIPPEVTPKIIWENPKVGESKTIRGMEPLKDRVMVVGNFWDDKSVVILDIVV